MKYIVSLAHRDSGEVLGYYASNSPWKAVGYKEATQLSHKTARSVMGKLKRLGYAAMVVSLCAKPKRK